MSAGMDSANASAGGGSLCLLTRQGSHDADRNLAARVEVPVVPVALSTSTTPWTPDPLHQIPGPGPSRVWTPFAQPPTPDPAHLLLHAHSSDSKRQKLPAGLSRAAVR